MNGIKTSYKTQEVDREQKADGLTGEKAKEKKNIESGKVRKEIQG